MDCLQGEKGEEVAGEVSRELRHVISRGVSKRRGKRERKGECEWMDGRAGKRQGFISKLMCYTGELRVFLTHSGNRHVIPP